MVRIWCMRTQTQKGFPGSLRIAPSTIGQRRSGRWIPQRYHNSMVAPDIYWRSAVVHLTKTQLRRVLPLPTAVYGRKRDRP
jgi:hypothetical protein